jgi:hypothetical protein
VRPLPLDRLVNNRSSLKANEVAPLAGLLLRFNKRGRFGFRKDEFAYKPTMEQLSAAFREELFYFLLLLFFGCIWLGSTIFTAQTRLTRLEQAFRQNIEAAMPGTVLPLGQEVQVVQNKVKEMEERLRSMGTLSSLSPLNSLKELSEVITSQVDVALDSISIGHSRISLAGSVADFPTVGKLSSALEKRANRFCDVKVDPKGQVSGSSRVRFTADIKLCE